MKPKLVSLGALASIALFAGCNTLPPGAEPGPSGTMAYNVTIEASEPGAIIKANGQDIGHTPVTLKIYGDTDGTFHDFGSYYYVIQASGVASNQFTQTRVYRTGHLFTPEDMVPRSIFFDMSKPAPTPSPDRVYQPGVYYGPEIWIGPPPGPYGPYYRPGPYWRRRW
jgi:hypothetical protein